MSIIIKKPWTRQPQTPVGIDWRNPITKGLEFAYNTRLNGYDPKTGKVADSVGAIPWDYDGFAGTGVNGVYLKTRDSATLGGLANSTVFTLSRTTALLGGEIVDISANGNAIYSERGSSGSDIYKLGFINVTSLYAEFTYRNDSAILLQQRVIIDGANDNRLIACALIKNGTSHTIYGDGVSTTGTFGSSSTSFTDATNESRIGSDKGDSVAGWNGAIPLVIGWSRSLSIAELDSLRRNPWQIFEPQKRILFAPSAVVVGGFVAAWARNSNIVVQNGE